MRAQGYVLVEFAFHDPNLLVEIAKPLVDHGARRKIAKIAELTVRELRRFIDSRDLAITDLHQQLKDLVRHGASNVLLFLWRDLARVKHHEQIIA